MMTLSGSRRSCHNQSSRLFGALVQSQVSSIDVRLDIPDLLESADVVIPTFHKQSFIEVYETPGQIYIRGP